LSHVLAHEMTHRRHLDHIWSLVRCICLCVYWFNPLVWVAAWLSKRDCELACDEGALKRLGDDQRIAYGKTLVDLVAENVAPGQLLETATAMHETKKQMKARVSYIVKKPKVLAAAVVVLVVTLAIVTGCTFGGQKETEPNLNVPETTEATKPTELTENTKPTEATKPTEPKPTEPKPTEPIAPTQPKPVGEEVFPDIPRTETLQARPEGMTPEEFVLTVYNRKADWFGGRVSFRIPALLPINEDAIAVNNEIYEFVNGWVQSARNSYDAGGNYNLAVDYAVFRKNDLISLVISRKKDDATSEYAYTFDLNTGNFVKHEKIAREYDPKLEYPQLLYAMSKYYKAENSIKDISKIWEGKELYFDDQGVVKVRYGENPKNSVSLSTLNPAQYSLDDCYRWMFDFVRNGYKDEFSDILVEAFLDAPQTFLMQYIKKSSSFIPKKMWNAESELAYAVARTIMMDRENSYLLRCGAYGIASNHLPEEEQYAFLKEVYDAYTDEEHSLLPSGKEFFNNLKGKLVYGRDIWRQIELEYRTEVIDATWQVCYYDVDDKSVLAKQFATNAEFILDYETFAKRVQAFATDKNGFGYHTDVTSTQCPKSFDEVCASITESTFEDHVLIWVRHFDLKSSAPKVTKVDYDSNAFWNNPYQVHMDCADVNDFDNNVEYVILITIPREQYRAFPENYNEQFYHSVWDPVCLVLNGMPYVKMDY